MRPDRARAYRRLLRELDASLDRQLAEIDAESLRRFLDLELKAGAHPNTVRKHVEMFRAHYRREYESRRVSADALLAVLSVKPPHESTRRAQPQPYTRKELSALHATLGERWPKLPEDEASYWLRRWLAGRSPYRRIRTHSIRCQLDAIIAMALHCGLRRREIFALGTDAMHDDNAYIVVWAESAPWGDDYRAVPYTDSARALIAPWCRMRSAMTAEHSRAWLNLHAEPTAREPMRRDTFHKLLRTYLGAGWTLARLRATCGVAWAKAGLPPEDLRQLLGLSGIEDTLPYLRLIGGSLERHVHARAEAFAEQIAASA